MNSIGLSLNFYYFYFSHAYRIQLCTHLIHHAFTQTSRRWLQEGDTVTMRQGSGRWSSWEPPAHHEFTRGCWIERVLGGWRGFIQYTGGTIHTCIIYTDSQTRPTKFISHHSVPCHHCHFNRVDFKLPSWSWTLLILCCFFAPLASCNTSEEPRRKLQQSVPAHM